MQTKQQPLVLTGSGTIAMDAAVCNFLSAGDKAVVIRGGKFGERWGKICEAYGVKCVFVDVEWGKSVDAKAVAKAIEDNPDVRAVYATACAKNSPAMRWCRKFAASACCRESSSPLPNRSACAWV